MNTVNNVNGVGAVGRNDVYTLDRNGPLLAAQVALVRKIVTELNEFDNVIYEISNEPYFGGVTMAWQHHIADTIVETERTLPSKHLISQNIANKSAKIADPHPSVSIFNFHYATPPDAVATNYALNKVIGDDETGFRGVDDAFYRSEAWEFVLAGGGLYNNLDYSFTVGHENGTFAYPSTQPGGGSRALRRQLKVLRDFMDSFDFVRMSPDDSVIKEGVPDGGAARALVDPGKAIAIYVRKPLPPAKPAVDADLTANPARRRRLERRVGHHDRQRGPRRSAARRWHPHARVSAVRARYRAASEARVAAPVVFPNEPCHTVAHLGYQMSKPQPESKVDVWQGTLALMVLKTLEVMGPLHGFGLARRIEQTSGDRLVPEPGHALSHAAEARAGRQHRVRMGRVRKQSPCPLLSIDPCGPQAAGERGAGMGERDRHHGALPGPEGVAMNLYVGASPRGEDRDRHARVVIHTQTSSISASIGRSDSPPQMYVRSTEVTDCSSIATDLN